jgi:hypothetical protein
MARMAGGPGGSNRKYHVKHSGTGGYARRLEARGVSAAHVHMKDVEDLRRRQAWMAPYVANGTLKGGQYGALLTPIPVSRPNDGKELAA